MRPRKKRNLGIVDDGWKQKSSDPQHKGLENNSQNTCFLNVIIQALWHLNKFRESLIKFKEHSHKTDPCMFCSLACIFNQYKFSALTTLPATVVAQALQELHSESEEFKLGEMADAHECFNAILSWLHVEHVGQETLTEGDKNVCAPRCLSHEVFGMSICRIRKCLTCGANSEPEVNDSFLFPVYMGDILECHPNFEEGLKHSYNANKQLSCPDDDPEEYPCQGVATEIW